MWSLSFEACLLYCIQSLAFVHGGSQYMGRLLFLKEQLCSFKKVFWSVKIKEENCLSDPWEHSAARLQSAFPPQFFMGDENLRFHIPRKSGKDPRGASWALWGKQCEGSLQFTETPAPALPAAHLPPCESHFPAGTRNLVPSTKGSVSVPVETSHLSFPQGIAVMSPGPRALTRQRGKGRE